MLGPTCVFAESKQVHQKFAHIFAVLILYLTSRTTILSSWLFSVTFKVNLEQCHNWNNFKKERLFFLEVDSMICAVWVTSVHCQSSDFIYLLTCSLTLQNHRLYHVTFIYVKASLFGFVTVFEILCLVLSWLLQVCRYGSRGNKAGKLWQKVLQQSSLGVLCKRVVIPSVTLVVH